MPHTAVISTFTVRSINPTINITNAELEVPTSKMWRLMQMKNQPERVRLWNSANDFRMGRISIKLNKKDGYRQQNVHQRQKKARAEDM